MTIIECKRTTDAVKNERKSPAKPRKGSGAGKEVGKKPKKPKPLTVGKAKERAWKAFSDFIRLRDSLLTTGTPHKCRCVTCRGFFSYQDIQAGHGIAGRAKNILFDESLVFGQCKTCNVFKGGNYARYHLNLIKQNGLEWFEEKERISRLPAEKPWRVVDLLEIEETYQKKAKELIK